MLHQVLRRFSAEGRTLNVGDIVETSSWRNERLLLEHRFIGKVLDKPQQAPAQETEKAEAKPEQPAAIPDLPRMLQNPMPRKPVPVIGKVPVAKVKE